MYLRRLCTAALIASAFGCARSGAEGHATTAATRSSDVITEAELASTAVSGGDALEAVRRLRPRFLLSRGSGSIRAPGAGGVQVSLNGGPLQTLSFLSRMRPGEIAEIHYLSASEAAQRFGTVAGTGPVLLIKSK